jgi:predicted nucleic acid-binding protein
MILVDTGPLVALIHEDDAHHEVCKQTFAGISEPLGTVWPVLTEAMYLLGFSLHAQIALWEMIEYGAVELLPLGNEDVARMKELMRKYRDLPMDLADAALVRVAERERCAASLPWTVVIFRSIGSRELAASLSCLRACSLRLASRGCGSYRSAARAGWQCAKRWR